MATPVQDRYYLRTLHQEIDLFDRKLAHMLRYDSFANDAERKVSAGKLTAKPELLAKTARKLAEDGIEYKASELPRSFRGDDAPLEASVVPSVAATPEANEAAVAPRKSRLFPSPFAGTTLDVQADVQAYKRSRAKVARTQS